jgi:hypothetical protein
MRRLGAHLGLVLLILASTVATGRAQQMTGYNGSGWAAPYGGMMWSPSYGGFGWGRQFGVAGGPIVTTNGYLYPVYSPNGFGLSGFVNTSPVFGDWSSGYARYEPNRRAAIAALGFGPEASWGWRAPLLPRVAAPPSSAVKVVGPTADGSPVAAPPEAGREPGPQIVEVGSRAPSEGQRPATKPIVIRGRDVEDGSSSGPQILEIGRPKGP